MHFMTSLDIATRLVILAWLGLAGPAYACLCKAWRRVEYMAGCTYYSLTNKYFLILFLNDERTTHQLDYQIKSNRILSML